MDCLWPSHPKLLNDASVSDILQLPVTNIDEINYLWDIINQVFTAAAFHHISNELKIVELDLSPSRMIDFRLSRALQSTQDLRRIINKHHLNPDQNFSAPI